MSARLSRESERDFDTSNMIDDSWRTRVRLLHRSANGSVAPADLGFGDLAEMVAKAIRLPAQVLTDLYLRIEADGRVIDASEIRRLSEHREFPVSI